MPNASMGASSRMISLISVIVARNCFGRSDELDRMAHARGFGGSNLMERRRDASDGPYSCERQA
jgi:hypothetical protein